MQSLVMISVIIPTYNEAKALPRTLSHLLRQASRFEVIVVDGESTDDTFEIAAAWPQVKIVRAAKGRAIQMNAGAQAARGEWLLFLHADTVLPVGGLAQIEASRPYRAGGFRHRFSGTSRQLAAISWLHNTRCRLTGVFYGDQAMFVRRELFFRLGGFPELPRLEDIVFSRALKRAAQPVLLNDYVVTDSRKFEQHGIARSVARVLMILLSYHLGLRVRDQAFFEDVR